MIVLLSFVLFDMNKINYIINKSIQISMNQTLF